jgi:hypothetical protein
VGARAVRSLIPAASAAELRDHPATKIRPTSSQPASEEARMNNVLRN